MSQLTFDNPIPHTPHTMHSSLSSHEVLDREYYEFGVVGDYDGRDLCL